MTIQQINFRETLKLVYYYKVALFETKIFSNLDVYIVSHGGVGTSFFINYVSRFISTNEAYDMNIDHTKHLPIPPWRIPSHVKIIYVFGDPILATLSLFRRSYAHLQSCKNGSFSTIHSSESIDDYLKIGKDRLGLTVNFKNWVTLSRSRNNKFLFINYSKLWDLKCTVKDFLNLPESFIHSFPEEKDRSSNLDQFSTEDIKNFKEIYRDYYLLMDEIGDYKIL